MQQHICLCGDETSAKVDLFFLFWYIALDPIERGKREADILYCE